MHQVLEKEILRMELQVSQLIYMIANLNERLGRLEGEHKSTPLDNVHPFPLHRRN